MAGLRSRPVGPRRVAVRAGFVAVLSVGLGVGALVGVNPADAASSRPATTPTDWTERDASVDAAPAELAADVDATEVARVVAVVERNGKPSFDVTPVRGNAQARSVVSREQGDGQTVSVAVETKQKFVLGTQSNDQYRASQWALNTLNAESAWRFSRGAGQIVAVVDTGVANVPDLAGQVLSGVDFVGSSNGRIDGAGHGTHVAGIVAARAGNRIGLAGLAPAARILPVRVLDSNGQGWSSDIANGIVWATNRGASVINLSLGGDKSSAMKAAIDYAVSKGRVVVAAAGNAGNGVVSYPAGFGNVIAVGATDSSDRVTSFSSYGPHVDVSAPGQRILSTVPAGYARYSGTSMATPYVSAAVALLRSAAVAKRLGPVNPKEALEATAVDLMSPGRDVFSGAGRINPVGALCAIGACTVTTHVVAPSTRIWTNARAVLVRVSPARQQRVVLQGFTGTQWVSLAGRSVNASGLAAFPIRRGLMYRIVVTRTPTTSLVVTSQFRVR